LAAGVVCVADPECAHPPSATIKMKAMSAKVFRKDAPSKSVNLMSGKLEQSLHCTILGLAFPAAISSAKQLRRHGCYGVRGHSNIRPLRVRFRDL
jgi:hypothetical protein